MNALVLIALRKPYTFVVLAIGIILFGVMSVLRTPTDIFPNINIPVVAVVWSYNGLMPADMSGRIVYYYERSLTSTVSDIEHIESQSLYGRGIVKIFFQPGTNIAAAQAQIASVSQTVLKQMPTGTTPPQILVYNASSVPVLDLQIAAPSMTPMQLYDLASNVIRPELVSVPGVAIPAPYGGAPADVEVDLDQAKLRQYGISSQDVSAALGKQNLVLPAGDEKVGGIDYFVSTNASPLKISGFNDLPIRKVGDAIITLGDVANVHEGGPPQTNVVLVKGKQAVMLEILKSGRASTLSVVAGVKALIPQILKTVPPGVTIMPLNDASGFVKSSVADVVQEMVIAALLTGVAVLLFLGSWRSTLIVATSIPLSILSAIMALSWMGQTINVMTLGGLALAVGILVDHSIVMIENIDTHLEHGKPLHKAIVDAANQIVVPSFVATLCICVVFFPLFQLSGVAGSLFLPLGEAIVFAMIASFILSRTLVPTMSAFLLKGHGEHQGAHKPSANPLQRFQKGFERGFERFRRGYVQLLEAAVAARKATIVVVVLIGVCCFGLVPFLGEDFFPSIKSGEIDMHFRAPIGTRIEDASEQAVLINDAIRTILPGQVENQLDNCGLPVSGINEAYSASGTIGPQDCDVSISLKNPESPVVQYRQTLRDHLSRMFPGTQFTFLPGDITAKVLNFGLPAPIDIQVIGRKQAANMRFAEKAVEALRHIPGIADVNIQQAFNAPTLHIDTSRLLARDTGLTEANVAGDALSALSGSGQTAPTYWLDPNTGVSRLVNVQTPQDQLTSVNSLANIPISEGSGNGSGWELLGALSGIHDQGTPELVSHYNILPVIDIYASNEGRDLGSVSAAVKHVMAGLDSAVPRGTVVHIRGQADTMTSAYSQLLAGIALAGVLIYLIIVVNFQSWLDPFVILTTLPIALSGVVVALFVTGTTLSVPALTGALMCMGVATANAILVVSFARERIEAHHNAIKAAIEAGAGRFRPVLMTALAMVLGMLPMSMSNTQNAPLGRAAIGGLIFATVATLILVPCIFAVVHHKKSAVESLPQ